MTTSTGTKPADPLALLRTRSYVALLVLAAILGVPIAVLAYFFLKLVDVLQKAVFTHLSYVISVRLTPPATQAPAAEPAPAPAPAQTAPAHGTVPPT